MALERRDKLGRRRRASQNVGWKGTPDKGAAKAGPADRTPPKHLNRHGRAWWTWATGSLDAMGILDKADMAAVELGAETFAELRQAMAALKRYGALVKQRTKRGIFIRRNPAALTAEKARAFLRALYADLGLTPTARAKFAGTGGEDEDHPFEKLLGMQS